MAIFWVRDGGLAIYGGIIAAVLTTYVYTKIKKLPLGAFADTAIPSLALGQAIGRWGNFINREAFGNYTDSLFALQYVKDQVPAGLSADILANTVLVNGIEYIQVHPTFLYESLWNFALCAGLIMYRKYAKRFDGEVLALYLFGYGLGRFFIENLRTDQLLLWGTGLAVSQVISGLLVVSMAVFILVRRIKAKRIA